MVGKKWLFAGALLACVIMGTAYSNHFHNGFHFDDAHVIRDNMNIRNLENIPSFFVDGTKFSSRPINQSYRPILTTLNALEYRLGSGDPFWFHVTSFFFYVVLCIFYYFFLRKIFDLAYPSGYNNSIALAVTAVYSVHTANAETINYICARSDSLSSLAVVASLVVFMYRSPKGKHWGYLLPLSCGLLVKPTIAVFPLLLMSYVLLLERGLAVGDWFGSAGRPDLRKAARTALPSLLVCVSLLFLSAKMTPATFTPSHVSRLEYVLTQPYALLHYFLSFFAPTNLCADIEFEPMRGMGDERFLLGVLFIALMFRIIFSTSKKQESRPIAFGLLWFFIASLPTSGGVIPLGESMNDHRMFFPFLGLMAAVSWWIRLALSRYGERLRNSVPLKLCLCLCFALILFGHAYGTHARNEVWRNEESLARDVVEKRPANKGGLMEFGMILMGKGDYARASELLERALFLDPTYPPLQTNMGILKETMGQHPEAESHYRKALDLERSSPAGYYFYARFLNRQGRSTESIALLRKCMEISPSYTLGRYLLMDVYAREKAWGELIALVEETLALYPDDPKALKYDLLRKTDDPDVRFLLALGVIGGRVEQYLDLGAAFFEKGMFRECIVANEIVLNAQADSKEAYANICAAYIRIEQWKEAEDACSRATAIDPDFPLARQNLEYARSKGGGH